MTITRRRRADGSTAYQVRVSIDGERPRAETVDTWREARRLQAELIAKRTKRRSTDETCDELAERWPRDFPLAKTGPTRGRPKDDRTNVTNRERLKPFIKEFKGVPLADVDRTMALKLAAGHPRAAIVARGMFQDAVDAGLLDTNPFSRLNLQEKPGRRHDEPLTIEELHDLADLSTPVYGPEYGPMMRAMILFTSYVGPRNEEARALQWPWVDFGRQEVRFEVAKFGKRRTVALRPEAADALRSMPRRTDPDRRVFRAKRGGPMNTSTAHWHIWNEVRVAFWAKLPEHRRRAIRDLDWHSLRHFTGWLFYVHLGFSDEDAAYQLGHDTTKEIHELYGHGQVGALERLKRTKVHQIRATRLPHAREGTA